MSFCTSDSLIPPVEDTSGKQNSVRRAERANGEVSAQEHTLPNSTSAPFHRPPHENLQGCADITVWGWLLFHLASCHDLGASLPLWFFSLVTLGKSNRFLHGSKEQVYYVGQTFSNRLRVHFDSEGGETGRVEIFQHVLLNLLGASTLIRNVSFNYFP